MADDATQADDSVEVVLDGKTVAAHPDEWLIAVAERTGTYIPRFCFHPRMRPVGMCRMCIVEVKGPRGFSLLPSCYIKAKDATEVITNSEKVKKAQDGVLELLLINHPLDCPVCDKGGECPLQDQTVAFGPGESRMVEEKRHWEKPIPLSDLVLLDRERCIQCDRCTRFAMDVAGDPLITFQNRGNKTEINTFPDDPFSSYFSGNTVQICPVGALTSAPYRFKARPWDLEQVESTCTSCAVGCRIAVQSSGDRLTRYLGVDSDPVNQGWLCDRGRYDYESVNSADRITAPLVRKGGELVEVSWGEALEAAAKGIADAKRVHGPAAVAVLGGARLPNEDAYAWAKLAKSVIGTDNVDCQMADGLPPEVILGLPRATIDDACRARAVVLLGPDLKEELPVLHLRLRSAAVDDGVPLIELAPASTGLTKHARVSIGYLPGEAAGAARKLVNGDVDGIGDLLSGGVVVVVLGRPSLAESAESIAAAAAVLAAIPGARFHSSLRRANVHGALDMGLAPGLLPGRVRLDEGREWFSQAWGVMPEEPGLDATEILREAADGRMAALVLLGADPAHDLPDRELATKGLAGAGFTIAVDTFLTASSSTADVVLPAAMFADRAGTTTSLEGRITRLGRKVTAPGVAWPDWMIAVELAVRLGDDLGFESLDDIWAEIERLSPAHAGITSAMLADPSCRDGILAPLDPSAVDAGDPTAPADDPGVVAVQEQGAKSADVDPVAIDDGAEPEGDVAADDESARADRPSLLTFDPSASAMAETPHLDAYALRLVTGRQLYDAATLTQKTPALASLARPLTARANPYDLDRLGLGDGGRLRLRSPRGGFVIDATPDTGVPRGAVWLAFNLVGEGPADLIDLSQPVTDVRLETT